RYGSVPVILAGLATTAFSAILAAVAPLDGGVLLGVMPIRPFPDSFFMVLWDLSTRCGPRRPSR
ncbi:MAG: hypothetical protein R6X27_18380, partial [Candidatus Desulfacyla sp.]